MSTHKWIDRVCVLAAALAVLISAVFMNAQAIGIQAAQTQLGYEERLFDTSRVHTIDIQIDDWDTFLTTCQSEEYSLCDVVIDGEAFSGVGIRGKGNTSLSTVSGMDSDRYSFKLEFDQYNTAGNYYGLDKLSLNNLIQDNTMMKDYLVYQMMGSIGAAAPLCSYVYITVNGEDWGLYLAVECVEESFLRRNFGTDYGDLYKPDSTDMGGGRGNGMGFDISEIEEDFSSGTTAQTVDPSAMMGAGRGQGGFDPSAMTGQLPENFDPSGMTGRMPATDMGGLGMGSEDVKLQYIDDDPDSYSNIFGSAKTDVTTADQNRLIQSLKTLSSGEDIASAVDVDAVLRYFVVHNFVVNSDSYTGSMVHNYYLYEEEGLLSMIPWDYNLAFGTFQGGNADSAVNDHIDSPLSVGNGDRPMAEWIFESEEYTALYHQYFREFLEEVDMETMIRQTAQLIAPYVQKDPTAFCSYEEFQAGVEAISLFCSLRAQSVRQQLAGEEGTVDASALTLSDMGTMSMGGRGGLQMPGQTTETGDMTGFIPGQMPQATQETTDETTGEAQWGGGRGGFGSMGNVDMMANMGSSQAGSGTGELILLGVSMAVLLLGLLFAFQFKH